MQKPRGIAAYSKTSLKWTKINAVMQNDKMKKQICCRFLQPIITIFIFWNL